MRDTTTANEIVYRFTEDEPWQRGWSTDVELVIGAAARVYHRRYPQAVSFQIDLAERDPRSNRDIDGEMRVLDVWIRVDVAIDRCLLQERARRSFGANGKRIKRGRFQP